MEKKGEALKWVCLPFTYWDYDFLLSLPQKNIYFLIYKGHSHCAIAIVLIFFPFLTTII